MSNLLFELDRVMTLSRNTRHPPARQGYWTEWAFALDPSNIANQDLAEHGQNDFLGCMIGSSLTLYAKEALGRQSNKLPAKKGRLYLDYAVRGFRRSAPGHGDLDLGMIHLLLSLGAQPSEKIWIYDGRTVCELYLAYLHRTQWASLPPHYLANHRNALWVLVDHGVELAQRCAVDSLERSTAKYGSKVEEKRILSTQQILETVFGDKEASAMCAAIARSSSGGWIASWKWW